MNNIKIEKSIPLPDKRSLNNNKYPYKEMDVGDSFIVSGKKVANISSSSRYWHRKTGFTFICRTVEGGVRIWRII